MNNAKTYIMNATLFTSFIESNFDEADKQDALDFIELTQKVSDQRRDILAEIEDKSHDARKLTDINTISGIVYLAQKLEKTEETYQQCSKIVSYLLTERSLHAAVERLNSDYLQACMTRAHAAHPNLNTDKVTIDAMNEAIQLAKSIAS